MRSQVRARAREREADEKKERERDCEQKSIKRRKTSLTNHRPLIKKKKNEKNATDLYAIVKTTEKLERAYVRDAIPAAEYEPACSRLIGQFRTLWETLRPDGSGSGTGESAAAGSVPDVQQFMNAHGARCPMAVKRLIYSGLPATVEHGKTGGGGGEGSRRGGVGAGFAGAGGASSSASAVAVAESVQHFITSMDSLKLNMVAVDQVYPLLADLAAALGRVGGLPPDWTGREKVKKWVSKVHALPASRELDADDVRQLLFDLESAYNEFMAAIGSLS